MILLCYVHWFPVACLLQLTMIDAMVVLSRSVKVADSTARTDAQWQRFYFGNTERRRTKTSGGSFHFKCHYYSRTLHVTIPVRMHVM